MLAPRIPGVEIPGLTSLRGLAAAMVVLYHCGQLAHHFGAGTPGIWRRGYLAVDLFFFLSGFVLAHVYGAEMARPKARVLYRFLWARFCRIYPMALFTVAVLATAHLLGMPLAAGTSLKTQVTAAVLMMQVPWLDRIAVNQPAWSISAEVYAYLLFPLAASVAVRCGHKIAAIISIALLVLIGARQASLASQIEGCGALVRALPEFALGMFVCRAYQAEHRSVFWRSDALLFGVAGLIVVGYASSVSDGLLVILFPSLLLAVAANRGLIGRLLEVPPLRALGDISYSVYIFQMVPLTLANAAAELLGWHGDGLWPQILITVFILICGVLVHRRVDVPARSALRRLPDRLAAIVAARRSGLPLAAPIVARRD
jgi:peptidoglycan/LPS O-acetylase OafA/YrhL